MRQIMFVGLDAAAASIFLIPLLLLLNQRRVHDLRRSAWYFVLAVYLSGVYAVVGLPDIRYMQIDLNINLIPFAYMFSDFRSSILNVVLFLPLGFLLPALWQRFQPFYRTVLFGLGLSLLIELLQMLTLRATDVNDLITNTVGTAVGWCIARMLPALPGARPQEQTQDLYIVCGLCFDVMFFLQPFLVDFIWFLISRF